MCIRDSLVDIALASQHPLDRSTSFHAHAYPRSSAIIHLDACALAHRVDDRFASNPVPVVATSTRATPSLGNSLPSADVANATTRHATAVIAVVAVVLARDIPRDDE